jgi:hypothetical protein
VSSKVVKILSKRFRSSGVVGRRRFFGEVHKDSARPSMHTESLRTGRSFRAPEALEHAELYSLIERARARRNRRRRRMRKSVTALAASDVNF